MMKVDVDLRILNSYECRHNIFFMSAFLHRLELASKANINSIFNMADYVKPHKIEYFTNKCLIRHKDVEAIFKTGKIRVLLIILCKIVIISSNV